MSGFGCLKHSLNDKMHTLSCYVIVNTWQQVGYGLISLHITPVGSPRHNIMVTHPCDKTSMKSVSLNRGVSLILGLFCTCFYVAGTTFSSLYIHLLLIQHLNQMDTTDDYYSALCMGWIST